jgi:hypothetical protein
MIKSLVQRLVFVLVVLASSASLLLVGPGQAGLAHAAPRAHPNILCKSVSYIPISRNSVTFSNGGTLTVTLYRIRNSQLPKDICGYVSVGHVTDAPSNGTLTAGLSYAGCVGDNYSSARSTPVARGKNAAVASATAPANLLTRYYAKAGALGLAVQTACRS